MKICVIGAGAIGGLIAARLAGQGEAVSVLARGRTLDAIREHGIVVHEADPAGPPDGPVTRREYPLQASDEAAELGPQDVVIISVKYNAMIDIDEAGAVWTVEAYLERGALVQPLDALLAGHIGRVAVVRESSTTPLRTSQSHENPGSFELILSKLPR